MRIEGVIVNLTINRQFIDEMINVIPTGFENAISSKKIMLRLNKNSKFLSEKGIELAHDSIIGNMAYTALFQWGIPVVSCARGRYLVKTTNDKNQALKFMESNGHHLGSDKQPSKKYTTVLSIQVREPEPPPTPKKISAPKNESKLQKRLREIKNKSKSKIKDDDVFFNTKETVEYFKRYNINITVQQLNQMRHSVSKKYQYKLKFYKIIGSIYYKEKDIIEYIETSIINRGD